MMWLFFLLVLLIPLLAVVLDSQLGRALARRVENGAESDRLAGLESEVERIGHELEILREQTEFVSKLLEDRARDQLPRGDSD